MSVAAARREVRLEWVVRGRPRSGEAVSGDLGLVRERADGAIVAAIDGLGHGAAAADAAGIAASAVLGGDPHDLLAVMERCHGALAGTRGAAVSLAWLSFADATLTWLALGDVEGRRLSARPGGGRDATLRLPGGVAGHDQPTLVPETVPMEHGDVLVLATDGVHAAFADDLDLTGPVSGVAERILGDDWDGTDDALVVVLRWLTDGSGVQ